MMMMMMMIIIIIIIINLLLIVYCCCCRCSGDKIEKNEMGGSVTCMGKRRIEDFGGET
jgi:uncharacterized membrane protein